jgi:hypothetical protein
VLPHPGTGRRWDADVGLQFAAHDEVIQHLLLDGLDKALDECLQVGRQHAVLLTRVPASRIALSKPLP